MFNFSRNCRTFPQWLSHFTVLCILINTWKVSLHNFSLSNRCGRNLLVVLICISLMANDVEHYFYVLFCHLRIFFGGCVFKYFATASWVICFLTPDWFLILNWPLDSAGKSHHCSLVFCMPQSFPFLSVPAVICMIVMHFPLWSHFI